MLVGECCMSEKKMSPLLSALNDLGDAIGLRIDDVSVKENQQLLADLMEFFGYHCKRAYLFLDQNEKGLEVFLDPTIIDLNWDVVKRDSGLYLWPENGKKTKDGFDSFVNIRLAKNRVDISNGPGFNTFYIGKGLKDFYDQGLKFGAYNE